MKYSRTNKLILNLLFLFILSEAGAQNLTGYWQGEFSTDMSQSGFRRTFFLNMALHQDGRKIKGRFSTSMLYATDKPSVVYDISGIAGKKNNVPSSLMLDRIVYNSLSPAHAEVFLQFDQIRYFSNDTIEVLYGKWIPNTYGTPRSDGAGGVFWVRKLKKGSATKEMHQADSALLNDNRTIGHITDSLKTMLEMSSRKMTEQGQVTVHSKKIKLTIYDNGFVDNDSISIFLNDRIISAHLRVSEKPIEIYIELEENFPVNKILLFAENTGSISPNTALIIITSGDNRFELYTRTDKTENAILRLDYKKE